MQEINYAGNLFLLPSDTATEAAVVTTNGIIKSNGRLVMGRGIAGYSAAHHAHIDVVLADHVRANGNVPCDAGVYGDAERAKAGISPKVRVLPMPTKNDWRDPSTLDLILSSCRKLVDLADRTGLSRVYLPMPGCTNGRLRYEGQVRQAIAAVLDDRFIVAVPGLDALPIEEGRAVLDGYDRDAGGAETLATASGPAYAGDQLLYRRTIAALTGKPDAYDWYEISVAGEGRAMVFDPDGRLCPSQAR